VGDRRDIDAEAAEAIGMRGVWLNREGRGECNDLSMVQSLSQLPPLLLRG